MDLTLTTEEAAFRDEVRAWLDENHPGPGPRAGPAEWIEFATEWQRTLHAGGWAGISWPAEYGGRGATLIEQAIFGEEMARAKAPRPANVLGLVMGGPVLIAHGTEEQKERYLEPILSAEEIWCQGFSEPEAGSDLASLKTRAVRDDGGWRVTGQKVWTSFAQYSKWCMLVARTDPEAPKHKGLTYFLLDMEQDEVEVRPLRQITGEAEFNELFFEGAWIPDENVVGGVGNGWNVAITTLMNERAGLGASAALGLRAGLDGLIGLVRERGLGGDPQVRERIAKLGWPGIAVAEEDGGQGLGIVELGLLAEQCGYALAPTPLMSTWNAALFLAEGSSEQRGRWLEGIASGEIVGAAAFGPRDVEVVPDADGAAVLVLSAGEEGARVVEPD